MLGFLKLLRGAPMREERETYPCAFAEEAPYTVLSTPCLSAEELSVIPLAEKGCDRLYNSRRYLEQEGVLRPAGVLYHPLSDLVISRGNDATDRLKQMRMNGLVLDDASSALDYQTDANLRRALRENYRNTTTVLVAQRISSLRHADLILVLQDGAVIGAGTHDELMALGGQYAYMFDVQSKYYKEGEVHA